MAELNESALMAVLKHLPHPVIISDVETATIIWVNGYDPAGEGVIHPRQWIGVNLLDFVAPEQRPQALQAIEALGRGEAVPAELYRVRRLDGSIGYSRIASVPVTYQGRRAILTLNMDVSELETARRRLAEEQDRWRILVEALPEGLVVVADNLLVYANPAAVAAVGATSAEEIVGRSMYEFIDPVDKMSVREARKRALRAAVPQPPRRLMLRRLDGTPLPVRAQTTAVQWLGEPATQTLLSSAEE